MKKIGILFFVMCFCFPSLFTESSDFESPVQKAVRLREKYNVALVAAIDLLVEIINGEKSVVENISALETHFGKIGDVFNEGASYFISVIDGHEKNKKENLKKVKTFLGKDGGLAGVFSEFEKLIGDFKNELKSLKKDNAKSFLIELLSFDASFNNLLEPIRRSK